MAFYEQISQDFNVPYPPEGHIEGLELEVYDANIAGAIVYITNK